MSNVYTQEEIKLALAASNDKWLSLQKKVSQLELDNEGLTSKVKELQGSLSKCTCQVEITDPVLSDLIASHLTNAKTKGVTKAIAAADKKKPLVTSKWGYDYTLLAQTMPSKVPLKLAEINALLQFPNGVADSDSTKLPVGSKYPNIIAYIDDSKPTTSTIKSVKQFTLLHHTMVEKLCGLKHKKLLAMVESGEIVGFKPNKTNIMFFWEDVIKYLENLSKSPNAVPFKGYAVVPHVFYRKLYSAVVNDSDFAKLENDVIFGFQSFSKDWELAHKLLSAFEPTIGVFMQSSSNNAKGLLKVRDWIVNYRPILLEEMLELGDAGIITFLTKYTAYSKEGKLLNS